MALQVRLRQIVRVQKRLLVNFEDLAAVPTTFFCNPIGLSLILLIFDINRKWWHRKNRRNEAKCKYWSCADNLIRIFSLSNLVHYLLEIFCWHIPASSDQRKNDNYKQIKQKSKTDSSLRVHFNGVYWHFFWIASYHGDKPLVSYLFRNLAYVHCAWCILERCYQATDSVVNIELQKCSYIIIFSLVHFLSRMTLIGPQHQWPALHLWVFPH